MEKIIQEQINKCMYAKLENYDAKTKTYHLKQYTKDEYIIGKCYLVKVSKEIIKNFKSSLAANWNHGTAPQFEYLKIYISKTLGKNIYVDSIGFDINTKTDINLIWSGWLNIDDLEQVKEPV